MHHMTIYFTAIKGEKNIQALLAYSTQCSIGTLTKRHNNGCPVYLMGSPKDSRGAQRATLPS